MPASASCRPANIVWDLHGLRRSVPTGHNLSGASMNEDDVNLHLGRRIRRRRRMLGLTQSQLGGICGVGYQQIQKYETADSRIFAAQLWRVAEALGQPVSYFYEGLPGFEAPHGQD